MNTTTAVIPLGCAECGVPRRRHDADDHRYQVPEWPEIRDRAAALKAERRKAA